MPLRACTYSSASLARVLRSLDTPSSPAWVVGGFVRDALLDRKSPDIDIAINGDALQAAREAAAAIGGSYVPLKEGRRIARVVVPVDGAMEGNPEHTIHTLDVAGFDVSIENDLSRRDFTIDAIAVPARAVADYFDDPSRGHDTFLPYGVDPYGGVEDLRAGILRAVSPGVFEDDPGRLLRAVRLSAELGLFIETRTEEHLRESVRLVTTVAGERLREELLRLLSLDGAGDGLHYMDRLGLLGALLPELEFGRGVEQPFSHFWDVLEHSIQSVAAFEFIAGLGEWPYGNDDMRRLLPSSTDFVAYIDGVVSANSSRATLIKLACLLHDVAKPQTRTLAENGRARFLGHTKEGALLSREILQRLRFSQQETAYVETLVYEHLRPAQMSTEGQPSARAVYRFFRDAKDAGLGVLYLALADYLACRGPLYTMREWANVCQLSTFIVQEHARQERTILPSRLVDGDDIMRALAIHPGRTVGRLLEAVREAQASGQVATQEEALRLARETYERELKTVRTAK